MLSTVDVIYRGCYLPNIVDVIGVDVIRLLPCMYVLLPDRAASIVTWAKFRRNAVETEFVAHDVAASHSRSSATGRSRSPGCEIAQ